MPHSDYSLISETKSPLLPNQNANRGLHKIKYQGASEWDYSLCGGQKPVDVSLVLPHYRAYTQPVGHKLTMALTGEDAPVKVKVCRTVPQSIFELEILAEKADVTVWLPSDFKGYIRCSGRPSFSAGFVNRILRNVHLNEADADHYHRDDDVVVVTQGHITFRMWDIQTRDTENTRKECFRRLFGCTRKAPETAIDWDYLLRD